VFEVLIAAVIVVALVVAAMIPPMVLLWISVVIGSVGAALGLTSGFVYHARLWTALRVEGHGTKGMWLRPHHLHGKLSEPRRGPVQRWFWAGATGFGLTMLGSTGVLTAIVRLAGTR
jgi:hypothetical protein